LAFSQLLKGDPRVGLDSARASFVTLGDSSLDIEVYAYAETTGWAEFVGIREDILLCVTGIIEQGGTALALYPGRLRGTAPIKTRAAKASIREWRDKGALGQAHAATARRT
jgi:MscS family membrane protein